MTDSSRIEEDNTMKDLGAKAFSYVWEKVEVEIMNVVILNGEKVGK